MKLKKAFTLIEALIYIAILSILIVVIISFLYWSMSSNTKSAAMREVSDNAERIFEVMGYEIRESVGVYLPTTTSTQLSLETRKHLAEGEESSYIDFYETSSTVYFKRESSPNPIALTSDKVEVENLSFRIISTTSTNSSVQVGIKINYKNPSGRPEYSAEFVATSTFSIRSY